MKEIKIYNSNNNNDDSKIESKQTEVRREDTHTSQPYIYTHNKPQKSLNIDSRLKVKPFNLLLPKTKQPHGSYYV